MQRSNIVMISGGSFQGKSLISLKIASYFNFSGVVSTDAIRNVLKSVNPIEAHLSSSTYLISDHMLKRQKEDVSGVLRDMIEVYEDRGEHLVIEGMHFSDAFLKWVSEQRYHKLCVDNRLPLCKRIIYKTITRSRLRMLESSLSDNGSELVDEANVHATAYMKYGHRIDEIHSTIIESSRANGFEVIEYSDISHGIVKAIESVRKWISAQGS